MRRGAIILPSLFNFIVNLHASDRRRVVMSLFLLTFFVVYGGVHVYTFLKIRATFGICAVPAVAFAFFLLAMVLAPLLVRVAERRGLEELARFLAYTGYTWMGLLFLFFSASLAIDIYRILLFTAERLLHLDMSSLTLSKRSAFLIPLVWGVTAALYGYFEALDIRTERVVIESPKIPKSLRKLTVVQISDVHVGLIVRQKRLRRILAKVTAEVPDILLSTGDLVDGQINNLAGLAELFQEVKPRYGKYAVTGNHEIYAGLRQAIGFTERAGFRMLRGETVSVANCISLAGIDDPAASRSGASLPTDHELLSNIPQDTFIIFLKHRPAVEKESIGLFDLQLSGHVHKGQLWPFNLVTYLFYPVKAGFSLYPLNSSLYVSRGSGTWGPPIRFLAPPEVTVIELVPAGASRA
jgi:predicted MPP superfamily phosphohydrolase